MNILTIIILILFVLLAVSGYRKGFVRKLASMLSLVVSVVLVSAILPYMSDFLKNYTPVYSYIVEQSDHFLFEQISRSDNSGKEDLKLPVLSSDDPSKVEQIEFIENLPIPDLLKNLITENNNSDSYRGLDVSSFRDYISHMVANVILNIVSFLAALIVVQIVFWILVAALDLISHLPGLNLLNHAAGLLLGVLQALFFLWLFFMLVTACSGTEQGLSLMAMIKESPILNFLYSENLFMRAVLRAAALFA